LSIPMFIAGVWLIARARPVEGVRG
jgi:hypothetical protein